MAKTHVSRILILMMVVAGGASATRVGAQGNTANVDVTILPASTPGQPPPTREGFTVCIGTAANRSQFGKQTTPALGVANQAFLGLPTGTSVVVTVEKTGFRGWELNWTLAAGWNNHIQAPVQPGSGGPSCAASIGLQQTAPATISIAPAVPGGLNPTGRDDSIRIMEMNVNNGAARVNMGDLVYLYYRVAGPEPTEMRVSETSGNFPEPWAGWKPYAPHPGGPLARGLGYVFHQAGNRTIETEAPRKTFYLQFRRDGRVSNIGTATVDVFKKHVISGGGAVEEAKRQGFVFLTTTFNMLNFADKCTSGANAATFHYEFSTPGGFSVTGHCNFDIFIGRTLRTPWTLDSWSWDRRWATGCDPVMFKSSTNPNSLAGSVKLQFLNSLGTMVLSCAYEFKSITLMGPAGTDWKQAFAR